MDIKKKFEKFGMDIDDQNTGVFIFTMDEIDENYEEYFEKNLQIAQLRLVEIIKKYSPAKYKKVIFQSYNQEVVVIYNTGNDENNTIREITCIVENIKQKIKDDTNVSISAGVGRIYQSLKNVSISYQEAVRALKYRLVYGNNVVLYIESVELKKNIDMGLFRSINGTLLGIQDVLLIGKYDEVIKLIKNKINKLTNTKSINYYYIQQVYCHLLSILLRTIYEMGIIPEELYGKPVHLYEELFKKQTMIELEKWF